MRADTQIVSIHERQCTASTATGERCRAMALHGSDRCLNHDPGAVEAKRAAARAGGLERAKSLRAEREVDLGDLDRSWRLHDREDVLEARADAVRAVRCGKLPAKDGTAISTMLDSFSAELDKLQADAEREAAPERKR